jgi:helix-turn-helix protein
MPEEVEVLPLLLVAGEFPARPSSLLMIRDFVRNHLSQTPFSEDDVRALGERVCDVLLDVAGPSATIMVSVRVFPTYAEVDVLPSANDDGTARTPERIPSVTFADWLAGALRRDGMTMEMAARHLGVSTKTVGRWVGGTTEPRLRDLSRIRDVFGDLPFP